MKRVLSLAEFDEQYPDEEACWKALVQVRWPKGFRCPRCDAKTHSFIRTRKLFECSACRYQCSVTARTVLQDTKLPLRTWLLGLLFYATTKKSVSACELQRKLGLGSYETAWFLHRRLQHAFRKPNRQLRGVVEVDESYMGMVTVGAHGRGTHKAPVVIAVEDAGGEAGAMAAAVLPNVRRETLEAFAVEHVAPGTLVCTDGWASYQHLSELGFRHAPEVEGRPERAIEILPLMHRIAGNLRAVLNGTHARRVSRKYLAGYVAAFVFRFNFRGRLHEAFATGLQRLAQESPLTYRSATS